MKKVLLFSTCVDNLAAAIAEHNPSFAKKLIQGNWKNMPAEIERLRSGTIRGVILDETLSESELFTIAYQLGEAGFKNSKQFRIILLGPKHIGGCSIQELETFFT